MITEQDLQEAIAECQGVRNPTASTCIKLAAFLTIRRELYGEESTEEESRILPQYSYAGPPVEQVETVSAYGDSEFLRAIDGRRQEEIWPIMDELMSVLQATNPRLYAGVMRKIED